MNYSFSQLDDRILSVSEQAMQRLEPVLRQIDQVTGYNQQKILAVFNRARVSKSHFVGAISYGCGDRDHDALDEICVYALGAEDALICASFVSGTHALTVVLFGVPRPSDTMLSVVGIPYDTPCGVLGITGNGNGSPKEFGVKYGQLDLKEDGTPDYKEMEHRTHPGFKMVYIQRSHGYNLRPSLFVEDIGRIAKIARRCTPDYVVVVDNCYGEFVQTEEPVQHGADLIADSLIKNPGGGIASTGGYIVGRRDLVENCSYRLTTPSAGREAGCTLGSNRELFPGAFHMPNVTGGALETAAFASALFSSLGYDVTPRWNEPRADIIQAVLLRKEEALIVFRRGIQKGAPVDSLMTSEPWDMPGYDYGIIMAVGAFTLGASIELSADAPLREPFVVWMQGGLSFHSGKLGAMLAAQFMLEQGILPL